MKNRSISIHKMVAVIAFTFMSAFGLVATEPAYAQYGYNGNSYDDYGDYQVFYDDLAPYGQWYSDPQYGYVWVPRVGRDFRPYYSNGYWQMTEYGNMWVSGYPWGWAPFHYGRWAMSNTFGWIWIPGREWGPAWVTWRQGGGYYGWAPMGPGISIHISFGNNYYTPDPWWTFIPCGHIYSRSFYTYYAPRRTTTIIHNTTIINNTYVDNRSRTTYVTGPNRTQVETATRKPVEVAQVSNRSRAGASSVSRGQVSIYRPEIAKGQRNSAVPRNVTKLEQSTVDHNRTANAGNTRSPNQSRDNVTAPNRVNNQTINKNESIKKQGIQQERVQQRIDAGKQNGKPQQNIQQSAQPQRLQQQRADAQRQNTQRTQPVEQRKQQPIRNQPAPAPRGNTPTRTSSAPAPQPAPKVEKSTIPSRNVERSTNSQSASSPSRESRNTSTRGGR